ncbi:transporter substrate-binding domain-containing protein [Leptothrix discophora]|uniref:Transporter substrate-binding domain-containing protein n=1 Tax=Leptothrix discophora TaxID=89 RepID=A0ABT9G5B5_LEPDI|nr:transporter substrate-binding domain-containing protein [Leptothrix discophora]MDP4301586.1 transporter substrate-binding domain-containing protein [Leptothrix discophora]
MLSRRVVGVIWIGLAVMVLLVPSIRQAAWAAGAAGTSPPVARVVPNEPVLPVVRFAPEADYGPFVYRDNEGRVRGLSVDLLNRVVRHAGISMQTLPARPLAEILEGARRGEVDLITSLRPTPERAEFLGFTRPYVQVDAIVVGRSGTQPPDLRDLAGRKVAVGAGYAVEGHVRKGHPGVRWQPVADDRAALALLRAGDVDAVVADVASVHFIVGQEGWPPLSLGRPVGFSYPLSFAWRKDLPALGAALEAGLGALTQDERAEVLRRWMPAEALDPADDRRLPLMLAGAAALVFGAGAVLLGRWRRRGRARAGGEQP